jgi:putative RecB family exonuclease
MVKGRLDRLDSGPGGLRVIDYKTGAAGINAGAVIEKRTHIQLPLYARLIADERRQPVDNLGVFGLRDGRLRWLATDEVTIDELVRVAVVTAIEAARGIRAGDFSDRPADPDTCQRCDFGFLCRPDAGTNE